MSLPLLLITAAAAAPQIADTLRRSLDLQVRLATNSREALTALRQEGFSLVLLDEALTYTEDVALDQIYQHTGAAPLVELNFAICGMPRVMRQVRAAQQRRGMDLAQARRAATEELQARLNGSLAGLLLESELLLRSAAPADIPRARHLVALAGDLRQTLRA